ncbi:MAG TPA: right-handed parallel beta-helix repeat-containing protein [Rhizomicrobium sp.]|jgi:hypothetical protein
MAIRYSYAFLAAGVALGCLIQPVSAKTLQVGTCTTNPRQYTTIQAAVNAANPGDRVQVCPGSYPEQVVISQAMTLENVTGQASPTVTVPAGGVVKNTETLSGFPTAAQILVAPTTAATVNVENIVVDGTGNNDTSCGLELIGIYYQNAGGTISGDTAQNQLLPPDYQGCQDGEGIFVENQTSGTTRVKITNNTVTNFDKNGITVSYGAANVQIENNTVTGLGPTDVIAQNGIQLGYGATGTISGNQVSELIYTPETYGSSGILLYNTQVGGSVAAPKVTNNTVNTSQYGIVLDAVDGAANGMVQVKSNTVSGATFAGIGLYTDGINDDFIKVLSNTVSGTSLYDDIDVCSDNNQIKNNIVTDATEAGIHLDGECTESNSTTSGVGNSVASNQIDNNCVGILSGPVQGQNNISNGNHFTGNTNNYIYGSDTFTCGPTQHHAPAGTKTGATGQRVVIQPRGM